MNKKESGFLFLLIAIDLITKTVIQNTMALKQSIEVIPNFFHITYVVNTGAAWSMLEGKMGFFYAITIFAVVLILWMLIKTDRRAVVTRYGLVMILAGAIGNFIDRLWFKYVRDFLDFYIFGYDFPVFNVADMALCIGVFLVMMIMFLNKENYDESE